MVFNALDFGMHYTHHTDRRRSGYISTVEARAVLKAWGSEEPHDSAAILAAFMKPSSCKPEGQREHWPINRGHDQCPELATWGLVLGIERGWFRYDRSGFLQWSEHGRDRYAAGPCGAIIDSTGQAAFAF